MHSSQSANDGTLSAQTLIDAIIKHQISQGSSEPGGSLNINRDLTRSSFVSVSIKSKYLD